MSHASEEAMTNREPRDVSGVPRRHSRRPLFVSCFVLALAPLPAAAYEAIVNKVERPNPWIVNGCEIKPKTVCRLADLRHADLKQADLGGADLRGANMARADLRHVNLRGADL